MPNLTVHGRLGTIEFVEDDLGSPTSDGQILSSTTAGVRSWIDAPTGGGGEAGVTVQDEGSALTGIGKTLNFVGAGVTATGSGDDKTITIPGGGAGITVQDESSSLTTLATTLNFVGAGVEASGTGAVKTITIGGGAQPLPALSSFSIDIPSNIFTDTNLNVQHTVQYSISDASDFTDLTLIVTTGTNQTLTVPASDGLQSTTVTLAGIDTSNAGTVTFQLSGTNNGNPITSNTVTVTIAAPQNTELVYINSQSTNVAADFDTGTATSTPFVSGRQTLTIPTFSDNRYLAYAQLGSEPDLTAIIIGGINQLAAFTKTDNAITVNSQSFDVWVSSNLLVGAAVSGQSMEVVR